MTSGFSSAWLHGGCLAVVIGAAVFAVFWRRRWAQLERSARCALETAVAQTRTRAEILFDGRPDALTCRVCLWLVPLEDTLVVRCRLCGTSIPIPRPYLDLVRAQGERSAALEREAKEVPVRHPSRAIAWLCAAGGLVALLLCLVSAGLFGADVLLAALVVPVGMCVSAVGSSTLAKQVHGVAERYAAVSTPVGWACRNCAAPLVVVRDGASEVCPYCSAENLVQVGVTRVREKEARDAWAFGASIAHARARHFARLWTAAQIPFLALLVASVITAAR